MVVDVRPDVWIVEYVGTKGFKLEIAREDLEGCRMVWLGTEHERQGHFATEHGSMLGYDADKIVWVGYEGLYAGGECPLERRDCVGVVGVASSSPL